MVGAPGNPGTSPARREHRLGRSSGDLETVTVSTPRHVASSQGDTVRCLLGNSCRDDAGPPISPGRPAPAQGGRAMGRGRAKAKQTKVARELKYSVPTTDFDALQRELSSNSSDENGREDEERYEDPYDDGYDDYRR